MFRKLILLTAIASLFVAAFAIADPAMASIHWPHHFMTAVGAAIAVPAIAEKGGWSIRQWCAYRGISVTAFYKMRQNGTAPVVTHPKGGPPRIMAESDAAWLKRINSLKDEAAAELRREKASAAGTAAAESPKHVSNRTRT